MASWCTTSAASSTAHPQHTPTHPDGTDSCASNAAKPSWYAAGATSTPTGNAAARKSRRRSPESRVRGNPPARFARGSPENTSPAAGTSPAAYPTPKLRAQLEHFPGPRSPQGPPSAPGTAAGSDAHVSCPSSGPGRLRRRGPSRPAPAEPNPPRAQVNRGHLRDLLPGDDRRRTGHHRDLDPGTVEHRERLHWVRRVTVDEDRHQLRTGSGPQVMATLRDTAISLLRLAVHTRIAVALRHHGRDTDRPIDLLLAASSDSAEPRGMWYSRRVFCGGSRTM